MGVRIFVGKENGFDETDEQAILFCSTTGQVLNGCPFFNGAEEAEMFLEWNSFDPRLCGVFGNDDLESRVLQFRRAREHGWLTRQEEAWELDRQETLAEEMAELYENKKNEKYEVSY